MGPRRPTVAEGPKGHALQAQGSADGTGGGALQMDAPHPRRGWRRGSSSLGRCLQGRLRAGHIPGPETASQTLPRVHRSRCGHLSRRHLPPAWGPDQASEGQPEPSVHPPPPPTPHPPGPGKRAHPRFRARPPRWRGAAPSAVQARRRGPAPHRGAAFGLCSGAGSRSSRACACWAPALCAASVAATSISA